MRRQPMLLTATAALLAAAPLAAQEYDVSRREFPFFGRELAIEVSADGPGALQVVRGEPGRIEVAAHADEGLTAFGLGGYAGDRLTLTALGAWNASYVVVVPEWVRVSVLLPGEGYATRVPDEPAPVLRWGPASDAQFTAGDAPVAPGPDGLFLVHYADAVPTGLILRDARLRGLELRIEGERFLVRSSEPLNFRRGSGTGQPLTLHTGDRPIDLVVTIPADTRFFQLRADQSVLLAIAERAAATTCQRALRVRTPAGERFRFQPVDGRLRCD